MTSRPSPKLVDLDAPMRTLTTERGHVSGPSISLPGSTPCARSWNRKTGLPGRVLKLPHDAIPDNSRATVTVCPSHPVDARFQVAPGERFTGAGFAAVGVGRDVDTGEAWA